MPIAVRPAGEVDFAVVTLGLGMVRLSPPCHARFEFAPSIEVHAADG
ncbi:MAG: hypothetical protein BMS9Abin07_1324 [Acidimicrobiia bacterium]|nr:MAG: hypothetical protein BMS9Abin07_1324 [Acidimicrobiia bacterium]